MELEFLFVSLVDPWRNISLLYLVPRSTRDPARRQLYHDSGFAVAPNVHQASNDESAVATTVPCSFLFFPFVSSPKHLMCLVQ